MWFHSQNLNEVNGKEYSPWRYGRCWWHFDDRNEISFEWLFGKLKFNLGLEASLHGDHTVLFSFVVPLISIHWGFSWCWLENRGWYKRFVEPDKEHSTFMGKNFSLRIFNWALWWDIYSDEGCWCSGDPKWKSGSFHFIDWLLGSVKCSERTLSEGPTKIPMQEKTYDATYKIFESTWRRKRWPFPKRVVNSTIDCKEGIPHPGKGTCSYNCDDDALFSQTSCVKNEWEAVGQFVGSVLGYRKRYPL